MTENRAVDFVATDITAFVGLIHAQGITEAAQAISEAENVVQRLQLQAQREVGSIRDAAAAEGEERGRRSEAKILAENEAALRRQRLWAREELLCEALQSAQQRLLEFCNLPGAAQKLERLIREAVGRLPEGVVRLSMPVEYSALVDDAAIVKLLGDRWQVELSTRDAPSGGGVVASTADGRLRYDNSFPERLRRIEDAARAAAHAALLGDWSEPP